MDSLPDFSPSPVPGLGRRFLDFFDWKINPVVLRDLRLYSRGKVSLIAYFLTLVVLFLLAILYVLIARYEEHDGRTLLAILSTILAVVCGALVPNLVFERFRSELTSRATELALMSPLTPARLIRGKLLGAWCLSLLVLSTASPMLATAYLLGGVNLLSILGVAAGVMLAGAVMPTLQLFMAAQKHGRALTRGLAALVFLGQFVLMLVYGPFLIEVFSGSLRHPESYYAMLFGFSVAGVLIAQFLYFVTVGRLRGEAENRDAAPRLSLAAAAYLGCMAGCLLVYFLDVYFSPGPPIEETLGGIAAFAAYAFCVGFVIVCRSNPVPPRNLREGWKDKPLRRLLLLPGVKSLSAFFILNAAAILSVPLLMTLRDSGRDSWRILCLALAPFVAVAFGMLCYRYLALPLVKEKRNPGLLPTTIILANLGLGIVSIFAMTLNRYAGSDEGAHALILGTTPLGLMTGSVDSWRSVSQVGWVGLCTLGVLLVLLLPIALGRHLGAEEEAEPDHAPR